MAGLYVHSSEQRLSKPQQNDTSSLWTPETGGE